MVFDTFLFYTSYKTCNLILAKVHDVCGPYFFDSGEQFFAELFPSFKWRFIMSLDLKAFLTLVTLFI